MGFVNSELTEATSTSDARPSGVSPVGPRTYATVITVYPGIVDYSAAKAATLSFSKSMALELAPYNILVNAVCPSLIRTPWMDRLADGLIGTAGATRDEVLTNFAAQIQMLPRTGTVDEVAAVVVFLASARASFITGSVYNVDGGFRKSVY